MPELEFIEAIQDVVIVHPDVHGDSRGRFLETYRRSWFPLGREMVQASRSDKQANSLVGLHYHLHQADYWYVVKGEARVVLHDLRVGSPTEGSTLAIDTSEADDKGIFIPPGVAHGFAALSDMILVYLVDGYYNPADELGVAFDDPGIGAAWGISNPIVSPRDRDNPGKEAIPPQLLPRYPLRT
ncbi:MAG: dTDP-4-dehydrorhamnose 3,5-epimerase [Actinobacteria bacterium]|nr:dTDP-4-dehydrorhamnose 3,5-epimerase [Actinomycetota bacterium]MCL6095624.1 dTDP-4-dehydrorhamnose 3,5-epimerase [Actinomycetota bacterium]